ncbi:hypothetical protein SmJEL517_g02572 [Synchytrium microbalum]|uniref:protein-serine/threonine phosphatase n=1 Tax=Synchytrium microbalum TaxID=1806994 RepID=A0A507C165_9FUNG|nr:uncharacterized protein SmJEL517_g02572 [Synchytrium microbalum]TPX34837.1 hypothetical protein SmJEL517_g02572 [Synchytrium microbalum]
MAQVAGTVNPDTSIGQQQPSSTTTIHNASWTRFRDLIATIVGGLQADVSLQHWTANLAGTSALLVFTYITLGSVIEISCNQIKRLAPSAAAKTSSIGARPVVSPARASVVVPPPKITTIVAKPVARTKWLFRLVSTGGMLFVAYRVCVWYAMRQIKPRPILKVPSRTASLVVAPPAIVQISKPVVPVTAESPVVVARELPATYQPDVLPDTCPESPPPPYTENTAIAPISKGIIVETPNTLVNAVVMKALDTVKQDILQDVSVKQATKNVGNLPPRAETPDILRRQDQVSKRSGTPQPVAVVQHRPSLQTADSIRSIPSGSARLVFDKKGASKSRTQAAEPPKSAFEGYRVIARPTDGSAPIPPTRTIMDKRFGRSSTVRPFKKTLPLPPGTSTPGGVVRERPPVPSLSGYNTVARFSDEAVQARRQQRVDESSKSTSGRSTPVPQPIITRPVSRMSEDAPSIPSISPSLETDDMLGSIMSAIEKDVVVEPELILDHVEIRPPLINMHGVEQPVIVTSPVTSTPSSPIMNSTEVKHSPSPIAWQYTPEGRRILAWEMHPNRDEWADPVTRQDVQVGGDERVCWAAVSMQGWREEMEDEHTAILNLSSTTSLSDISSPATNAYYPKVKVPACSFSSSPVSLFAVFDGHGGEACAKVASLGLPLRVARDEAFRRGDYKSALRNGYLGVDADMQSDPELGQDVAGCTAVTALITPDYRILVANAGDSRAVLSSSGDALPLSFDHKPTNPDEYARIRTAGSFVENGRVDGNLALSRALGDFEYKQNVMLSPERQIVTANPDVVERRCRDGDEFVVLACDGIWDCMTNQECIDFLRQCIVLSTHANPIQDASQQLLDYCMGSSPDDYCGTDNMTVLVVALLKGRKVDEWDGDRTTTPYKPASYTTSKSSSMTHITQFMQDPNILIQTSASTKPRTSSYNAPKLTRLYVLQVLAARKSGSSAQPAVERFPRDKEFRPRWKLDLLDAFADIVNGENACTACYLSESERVIYLSVNSDHNLARTVEFTNTEWNKMKKITTIKDVTHVNSRDCDALVTEILHTRTKYLKALLKRKTPKQSRIYYNCAKV